MFNEKFLSSVFFPLLLFLRLPSLGLHPASSSDADTQVMHDSHAHEVWEFRCMCVCLLLYVLHFGEYRIQIKDVVISWKSNLQLSSVSDGGKCEHHHYRAPRFWQWWNLTSPQPESSKTICTLNTWRNSFGSSSHGGRIMIYCAGTADLCVDRESEFKAVTLNTSLILSQSLLMKWTVEFSVDESASCVVFLFYL